MATAEEALYKDEQFTQQTDARATAGQNAGTSAEQEQEERDTQAERLRWQQWWQQILTDLVTPRDKNKQSAKREEQKRKWHKDCVAEADREHKTLQLRERKILKQLQPYHQNFQTCDLDALKKKFDNYGRKVDGVYDALNDEVSSKLLNKGTGFFNRTTVYQRFCHHLEARNYQKAYKLIEGKRAGRLSCWFGQGKEINTAIDQMHKKISEHRGFAMKFDEANAAMETVTDATAKEIQNLLRHESRKFLQSDNDVAKKQVKNEDVHLRFLMELATQDKVPSKKEIKAALEARRDDDNQTTITLPGVRESLQTLGQSHTAERDKAAQKANDHNGRYKAIKRFERAAQRMCNKGRHIDETTQSAVEAYTKKLKGRTKPANLPGNPLCKTWAQKLWAERPIILSRDFARQAQPAASTITPQQAAKPLQGLHRTGQRVVQKLRDHMPAGNRSATARAQPA